MKVCYLPMFVVDHEEHGHMYHFWKSTARCFTPHYSNDEIEIELVECLIVDGKIHLPNTVNGVEFDLAEWRAGREIDGARLVEIVPLSHCYVIVFDQPELRQPEHSATASHYDLLPAKPAAPSFFRLAVAWFDLWCDWLVTANGDLFFKIVVAFGLIGLLVRDL